MVARMALKLIEIVIFAESELVWGVSEDGMPPSHPFIDIVQMEGDITTLLNDLIAHLKKPDIPYSVSNKIVIVNSCLFLIRHRPIPNIVSTVVPALISLAESLPPFLSRGQNESIIRPLKLPSSLHSLVRSEGLKDYRDEINTFLERNGAKEIAEAARRELRMERQQMKRQEMEAAAAELAISNPCIPKLAQAMEAITTQTISPRDLTGFSYEQSCSLLLNTLSPNELIDLVLLNFASMSSPPIQKLSVIRAAIPPPAAAPHVVAQALNGLVGSLPLCTLPPPPEIVSHSDDFADEDTRKVKLETTANEAQPNPKRVKVEEPVGTAVKTEQSSSKRIDIPELADEEVEQLTLFAFDRVMTANVSTGGTDAEALLEAVIARAVVRSHGSPVQEQIANKLFRIIWENYPQRSELALNWMYEQFVADCRSPVKAEVHSTHMEVDKECEDVDQCPNYSRLLKRMMEAMKQHLSPRDASFTKFLLEIPMLSSWAFNQVLSYCHDEQRTILGLSTLRDLALQRPAWRHRAMSHILSYTIHTNTAITSPAIRLVANRLLHIPEIGPIILDFALEQLRSLTRQPALPEKSATATDGATATTTEAPNQPPEAPTNVPDAQTNNDTAPTESEPIMSEQEITLRLDLYFVLCGRQHLFLRHVVELFRSFARHIQSLVISRSTDPVTHIANLHDLAPILRDSPEGSDRLVLHMVDTITHGGMEAQPSIVTVMRDLHRHRQASFRHPVRFLLPVIRALEKDEIIRLLPEIIRLPERLMKSALTTLLKSPPAVEPVSLMIALHRLNGIRDAAQQCISLDPPFTQQVLAASLQQLVEIPLASSKYIMSTIIEILRKHRSLAKWVMTDVMSRLVAKKVWEFPELWKGFRICCEMNQPDCFEMLVTLPVKPLGELLAESQALRSKLVEYVQSHRVRKEVQDLLAQAPPARSGNKESSMDVENSAANGNEKKKRSLEEAEEADKR
eukprot:c9154_g1_i2.p1 GENE.c9154_g1_i2~~c9154_g1_i2.p1  ORF type:complete len:1130 (+),score=273.55 c9154_g1_i2:490-3390(+)